MSEHTLERSRCKISIVDGGFLTSNDINEVVVNEAARGDWSLKCHERPVKGAFKYLFIYHPEVVTLGQLVVTLDKGNNVVLTEFEPGSPDNQLWTLEDTENVTLPSNVTGRIQSVAKPSLSLDISWLTGAPELAPEKPDLRVHAKPNQPGSATQTWNLEFLILED